MWLFLQDAEEKAVAKRVPFSITPDTLQNVRDVSLC